MPATPRMKRLPPAHLSEQMLTRLADLPTEHPDRSRLREHVIEAHLPLANRLARRYRNRGEPDEDLMQVAAVGLIKAIDRYDVSRGIAFPRYAAPTILGELKRHFRDQRWSVRVPRQLQELALRLSKANEELTASLGRQPTVADLAGFLGVTEDRVRAGLNTATAYTALSLHLPAAGADSDIEMLDVMGGIDPDLERVEDRATLADLIARLPAREQRILALRFLAEKSQAQIAADIGVSQMQVSRLLTQSLDRLREASEHTADAGVVAVAERREDGAGSARPQGTVRPPGTARATVRRRSARGRAA